MVQRHRFRKLDVGDVLDGNNKVFGIVELEPLNVYEYTIGDDVLHASLNIYTQDTNRVLYPSKKSTTKIPVYHVLTDNRTVPIKTEHHTTLFRDYDYAIDKYL